MSLTFGPQISLSEIPIQGIQRFSMATFWRVGLKWRWRLELWHLTL